MKTTKYENQKDALAKHLAITGREFFAGYPEAQTESGEWYVCEKTGDVYYVYQTEKGGGCHGERILHKLTIHTSLGGGGFNHVRVFDGNNGFFTIHIFLENWGRGAENRRIFAAENILVTTLGHNI